MLHIPLTNLLLLAAKEEPYKKKAYLFMKNIEEFSGKNSKDWASRQKKEKTERVTGLGRKTRAEIVKWNQMTVLGKGRTWTTNRNIHLGKYKKLWH